MRTSEVGFGPKGGVCPKCFRETGSIKLHTPYCKGVDPTPVRHRPTKHYEIQHGYSTPAPLVGGPLHAMICPPSRGRWPGYLDSTGRTMDVRAAERYLKSGHSSRSGVYVLRQVYPANQYWYLWTVKSS